MDTNAIRPGTNFEQALRDALSNCDVLMALIGPKWTDCKRSDGRRRLDLEEDWVRSEIATALHRNVLVMPVLFGDATFPTQAELPEDLHLLVKQQKVDLTDTRWKDDVRELSKNLVSLMSGKPVKQSDFDFAINGLQLLNDLMTEPAVAESVNRSKEVIENTYRQGSRLGLFKAIHDALHTIEFECLRPMEAGNSRDPLRSYKRSFTIQAHQIKEAMQSTDMDVLLREEIEDQIGLVSSSFQAALDSPGDADQKERVLGDLRELLSGFSERLNSKIVRAADELNLARIVELMKRVEWKFPDSASEQESSFKPFAKGIDALQGRRDELEMRVKEHSRLQSLDRELRRRCVGGSEPRALTDEWRRIRQVRARLVPPFSSDLESAYDDLIEIESEIEAAILVGDDSATLDRIKEYFMSVGSVFRSVDTSLKKFCMRLSEVNQWLKTVLDMC